MGELSGNKKKAKHGKVARGQLALLPEEMGFDVCMLDDPRHEVFCREYALKPNGTKAYLRAFPGCKTSTANSNSHELLKKTEIICRIREVRRERMDKLEVTHEKILHEVAKLAFLDPREFYADDGSLLQIGEMDPDAVAALEGLKIRTVETSDEDGVRREVLVTEIKHANKRAALELLMRHKEMLIDKVTADVTHAGTVCVTDDLDKFERLRDKFRGLSAPASA